MTIELNRCESNILTSRPAAECAGATILAWNAVATGGDGVQAGGTTGVATRDDGAAIDEVKAWLSLSNSGCCIFTMVMCVDSCGFSEDFDFTVFPTLLACQHPAVSLL